MSVLPARSECGAIWILPALKLRPVFGLSQGFVQLFLSVGETSVSEDEGLNHECFGVLRSAADTSLNK